MNAEFDRIQQIFIRASAIEEPALRQAYLDETCGPESQVRRQVDALLFSHENAAGFLDRSVVVAPAECLTEAPGTIIGKYKLLQQIGEGGFGIVFMAEQLEPVERKVALKVLKPGMDTREVIARFEAERQALALMDHPNVARVLDGGTTVSGRPYFVMDLVKGAPITEFCDQNKLSPKDRLNLLLQVCAGVQHAHQKGVIHRDLKPTNVLVTVQDGLPLAKVIDFGIAKALGQKLTERTLFTRFEQLLGTPAYMSPEQAEWSGVDVDTRSDIYSLGVLLYELLTGTTPFEKETLARAALDEVRRTIREVDPPAPSTRLLGLGQRLSQIAQYRQTEPGQLTRLVRGELDWIVMRALEKERGRRYETVNALTRDIQRHLNDEPVSAGPPSKAYLAAKFMRRHRLAVASAAGVGIAFLLGLGLALFGFHKARLESRRAKAEAESADALTSFLREEILLKARPYANPTNRNITLREVLDLAAPKIDQRFSGQPLVAALLHNNVGNTYYSLGEGEKAEQHLRKAVALRLANQQGQPILDRLSTQKDLAEVLALQRHKYDEAEPILQNVAAESAVALGTNHWLILQTKRLLADIYSETGRGHQAEELYRSVLERQTQIGGSDSDDTLNTENSLALLYFVQGRFFDAADRFERILAARRIKDPTLRNEAALKGLLNPGEVYFCLGEYPKAAELLRSCVQNSEQVLGPNDPETTWRRMVLMKVEGCLGNWTNCVQLGLQMLPSNAEGIDVTLYSAELCCLLTRDTNSLQVLLARHAELLTSADNPHNREYVPRERAEVLTAAGPPFCDAAQATEAADRALQLATNEWTRIPKGIAEYRRGNFAGALTWLEEYAQGLDLNASQAGFFVAMSYWKLGDTNACAAALRRAYQKLSPATRRGYLFEFWHELTRAILAQREADALIPICPVIPEVDSNVLARARDQSRPIKRHIDRGTELGAQRRWAEARDEFMAALRSPQFDLSDVVHFDYEVPARIAAASLAANDLTAYREVRRRWLDWGKGVKDVPGDLITACFLPPSPGQPSEADHFASKFHYDPAEFDSFLATTLLAFRTGHFDRVLELKAPSPTEDPSIAQRRVKVAAGQLFRAMALAKTGHLSEGQDLLHQMEKTLAPYLEHYDGDLWWDIVFAKTALDEAHALFTP